MSNTISYIQKLGKALMTPVAVLPAAALMLRLGADDILGWTWMFQAGDAIFANLAFPIFLIVLWLCIPTIVSMPKTSVNENCCFSLKKNKVGLSK